MQRIRSADNLGRNLRAPNDNVPDPINYTLSPQGKANYGEGSGGVEEEAIAVSMLGKGIIERTSNGFQLTSHFASKLISRIAHFEKLSSRSTLRRAILFSILGCFDESPRKMLPEIANFVEIMIQED